MFPVLGPHIEDQGLRQFRDLKARQQQQTAESKTTKHPWIRLEI